MRRTWGVFSALFLLGGLLGSDARAQSGTIRGRVTADNGSPLSGAQVFIVGATRGTVSDARGLYVLPGIAAGTQTVRAQIIGYSQVDASVTVPAAGSVTHNFVLASAALRLEQVTVTVGSRSRVTAAEELTVPVDVFTRADLVAAVPQLEMGMALQELSPAIYFPRAQIADITSGVRPFQLRGLSPDHSLVLVNGKRRHPTAVVHVFGAASGGSGSSGVDMNALVPGSLAGMEILRDGAAAQYGSDAIAGVINVQLRSDIHSPEFSASIGQYTPKSDAFKRDGTRIETSGSVGFGLANRGTVVVSGMFSKRGQTDRAGPDPRDQIVAGDRDSVVVGADGIGRIVEKNNDVKQPTHLIGDGETTNVGFFANATYSLDADRVHEAYAFGGYSWRRDISSGFFRRSIQPQNWPSIHPLGFLPNFRGDNGDLQIVTGVRGPLRSWSYDGSVQYNRNSLSLDIFNTLNVSLGPCLDNPCAPGPDSVLGTPDDPGIPNKTDVYAGALMLGQFIGSFDVNREVQAGLASPLNVAMGVSLRADNYEIGAGETASWINGWHKDRAGGIAAPGAQVFTGFRPEQAVNKWRTNIGAYADLEADVTSRLRLAGALRFENYSDFGGTITGKLATRVKLAEQFIVRGAVSTGFRAPNIAQGYYSHVSTGFRTDPTNPNNQVPYEIGEIPVNSPEARALGAEDLREETAVNISSGLAWSPTQNLTFTVDGYRIDIADRIILTGSLSGPTVEALLRPYGAPTVKFFTNSVDTRTLGLDISVRYRRMLAQDRFVEALGQYNRNTVEVTDVQVPDVIDELQEQVFASGDRFAIENGRPKDRATSRIRFVNNRFRTSLSGNWYGLQAFRLQEIGDAPSICANPPEELRCLPGGSVFLDNGPHFVLDADIGFQIRKGFEITIGAENLTNKEPPVRPAGFNFSGNFPYYSTSGLHMNGRYIYTTLRVAY
jgi:iron complex outermembrane receptor protein